MRIGVNRIVRDGGCRGGSHARAGVGQPQGEAVGR